MRSSDVNISNEITYYLKDHETFLSFNCDVYNMAFQEWWENQGHIAFIKYFNDNKEHYKIYT